MSKRLNAFAAAAIVAAMGWTMAAAQVQTVTPKLAENVKAQAAYEAVTTPLYVGNPTSIHVDITPYSQRVAELDNVGERVNAIAKVQGWDWYLVGRNGVGIGYVSGNI